MSQSNPMCECHTLTGSAFRFKGSLAEELIVYPSGSEGQPQDKSALAITPFEIALVRRLIAERSPLRMGASRDNPPEGSLGHFFKREGLTPQHLSYLIPILRQAGECRVIQDGKAFIVERV